MLQTGLDDSGKDGISLAFTLAGYFGSANDLMNLADDWRELLDEKPVLKYVKGYEAFKRRGQFGGWSERERDERLLKFVKVIAKHSNKGIAFVIDNKPFDLMKRLPDSDGNYFRDPAEFAFTASISFFLQTLPDFGENVADIVFDRDLIDRRAADNAYQNIFKDWKDLASRLLRKEPHWEMTRIFCRYRPPTFWPIACALAAIRQICAMTTHYARPYCRLFAPSRPDSPMSVNSSFSISVTGKKKEYQSSRFLR